MTSIREVDADGNQYWINELGQWHQDDGPAIIYSSGHQEWYQHGKWHRDDGPALIYADGHQEWFQNGRLHRLDGPAIIYSSGHQEWYQHGKWHRLDGPAVIRADGRVAWWVKSTRISDKDIEKWMEDQSINPNWKEWSDAEIMSFALRFG